MIITVISRKLKTTDRISQRDHFEKKYNVSLSTMENWKEGRAHLPGDRDNWF